MLKVAQVFIKAKVTIFIIRWEENDEQYTTNEGYDKVTQDYNIEVSTFSLRLKKKQFKIHLKSKTQKNKLN